MRLSTLFRSRTRRSLPPAASRSTVDALAQRLRTLSRDGALALPAVGAGRTSERHLALCEIGREDLALARVAEAHTDALAILAEGECPVRKDALYGVWASDGPNSRLEMIERRDGALMLRGVKQYCSGSTFLDAALVTAYRDGELFLIDCSLKSRGLRIDNSAWKSPAFASTATGTVTFDDVRISSENIVGGSGGYLQRPGFWHGAIGPAACWAGGALGLVDAARRASRENPHGLAHLGALEAVAWGMNAVLDRAGREIDADPLDQAKQARARALSARHLIERGCTDVMDHFGRATGPALLAYDEHIAQRYAELTLYIRQCHAERDLQALGELARLAAS